MCFDKVPPRKRLRPSCFFTLPCVGIRACCCYVKISGVGQVFTTLALLNITQFTMGKFLYLAVQSTSESWVSIKRMETILLMEVGR